MTNQTPEQKARDEIDRMLVSAGWVVQSKKKVDLSAGKGVAVREFVSFLREIKFVRIEETVSPISKTKKMTELPKSILHPVRVKQFRMYSREELHDRKSLC